MQTMGAWPKWLGGSYVSSNGCDCQYYPNIDQHWITCPVRSLWGLNDTSSWSEPQINPGECP